MMSFLFCQECFTWVNPHNEHCPECMAIVDQTRSDPPFAQLRTTLGDVVMRLGEVRITRRLLPERGLLYATTRGLYFLPHQIDEITEYVEHRVPPSWLWYMAAFVFVPLRLIIPFLRTKQLKEVQVHVYRPQLLTAAESDLLPELMMDNPGAFFVPLRVVRMVEFKRDRWIIERFPGSKIAFQPDADARKFHERMRELVRSPDWRHVMFEHR